MTNFKCPDRNSKIIKDQKKRKKCWVELTYEGSDIEEKKTKKRKSWVRLFIFFLILFIWGWGWLAENSGICYWSYKLWDEYKKCKKYESYEKDKLNRYMEYIRLNKETCRALYWDNSFREESSEKWCICKEWYVLGGDVEKCIPENDKDCQDTYWENSYSYSTTPIDLGDGIIIDSACGCKDWYTYNNDRTKCVTANQQCEDNFWIGSYSNLIKDNNWQYQCWCREWYARENYGTQKASCVKK